MTAERRSIVDYLDAIYDPPAIDAETSRSSDDPVVWVDLADIQRTAIERTHRHG